MCWVGQGHGLGAIVYQTDHLADVREPVDPPEAEAATLMVVPGASIRCEPTGPFQLSRAHEGRDTCSGRIRRCSHRANPLWKGLFHPERFAQPVVCAASQGERAGTQASRCTGAEGRLRATHSALKWQQFFLTAL